MNIVAHHFHNTQIDQITGFTEINGVTIPMGYVNATQLCNANGKRLNNWSRLKRSNYFLETLSISTGIPVGRLLIGNESVGINETRGTWVHPDVAISIASWVSPEFEVWASQVLRVIFDDNTIFGIDSIPKRLNVSRDKAVGYVYLIGNKDAGILKIGHSTNISQRLRTLQIGCAFALEVVKTKEGTISDEQALHERFKKYRLEGEWFKWHNYIVNTF
ncbi:MAG: KilA-N domain-containing protein [Xenococcaceae cyanobacterium]